MSRWYISFIVLFLFAAAVPLKADVTVTAVDQGSGVVRITISPSGGAAVRGCCDR